MEWPYCIYVSCHKFVSKDHQWESLCACRKQVSNDAYKLHVVKLNHYCQLEHTVCTLYISFDYSHLMKHICCQSTVSLMFKYLQLWFKQFDMVIQTNIKIAVSDHCMQHCCTELIVSYTQISRMFLRNSEGVISILAKIIAIVSKPKCVFQNINKGSFLNCCPNIWSENYNQLWGSSNWRLFANTHQVQIALTTA